MKKKILLFILIILLTGCFGNNDTIIDGKEYQLPNKESITINDNLKIELLRINDSRCPEDAECFWQGELKYELLINDDNFDLSTVLHPEINYQDYLIKIVTDKCDKKTLVFTIEKNT